jgi:hypothetical protein
VKPDLDQSLRDLPMPPAPPLGPELAAELARIQPVVTRRPLRDLARVAAVSVVYGAVLLAVFHMHRSPGDPGLGWIIGVALAWLAGFGSLLWLAIVPRRGAVMPRWRAAGVGAVVTSALFVVGGLVLHPRAPLGELGMAHVHNGLDCFRLGLFAALIPVVLGALALRGAAPVGARWVAAGLGAAGGSLGGLFLHLHCNANDGWHVGLAHGGVVVVSALLAAALAPRRLET